MSYDEVQKVGAVKVEECFIVPNPELGLPKAIELTNFMINFILHESIFHNCLVAEMSIGDSANLIGSTPFTGGEIVTVKFRSPHLEDNPSNVIQQSFIVSGITNRNFKEDREQFYILKLISFEGYKDQTVNISKRFTGTPRDIFQEIYDDFIQEPKYINGSGAQVPYGALEFLDQGDLPFIRQDFCFIANYWTPFRCMNYLARQTAPNSSGKKLMPNVMYFQSNKRHYVVSLSRLTRFYKSQRICYDEFSYIPELDNDFMTNANERRPAIGGFRYTSPFVSKKYNSITNLSVPRYADGLLDQMSGYLGNLTVGFDMIKRQPYHMEFDYTPSQPERRKQNKNVIPDGYDDFEHITDETPLREKVISNPRNKINVRIGASNIWSDREFGYDSQHFINTAYRSSALSELNRLAIKVTVPGRTDVDLGMLVNLNFPSSTEKTDTPDIDQIIDKRMSGLYTITGIKHNINYAEHNMELTVVRDSVNSLG